MDCVHELEGLVEAMVRSLRKIREPVSELELLVRGVHEVARKLETHLLKGAAAHLEDGATGGAIAPPEQHKDEGVGPVNQPTGGRRSVSSIGKNNTKVSESFLHVSLIWLFQNFWKLFSIVN
jgi:hypothetical protein